MKQSKEEPKPCYCPKPEIKGDRCMRCAGSVKAKGGKK